MAAIANELMAGRELIYLAAPYSHPDATVRERRYSLVTLAAAQLVSQGHVVFSPLTMTHPIDKLLSLNDASLGSDYWVKYDETFMEFCTELVILPIDGWECSNGVRREISFFYEHNRPVKFFDSVKGTISESLVTLRGGQ